jgi:hypothetical protein
MVPQRLRAGRCLPGDENDVADAVAGRVVRSGRARVRRGSLYQRLYGAAWIDTA